MVPVLSPGGRLLQAEDTEQPQEDGDGSKDTQTISGCKRVRSSE